MLHLYEKRKKGLFGLELELCFDGNTAFPSDSLVPKEWTPTTDGSLRGNAREYIFKKPLSLEQTKVAVDNLFSFLNESKTTIIDSDYSSTHVHVNVSNLSLEHLSNLYMLSLAFEPILFEIGGDRRKLNRFCVPTNDSSSSLINYKKFLYEVLAIATKSDTLQTFQISVLELMRSTFPLSNSKYSGVSLGHLSDFGSLEYRMFGTSLNPEYPMLIVNTLQFLYDTAVSFAGPRELYAHIHSLKFTSSIPNFLKDYYKKANLNTSLLTHFKLNYMEWDEFAREAKRLGGTT